MPVDSYRLLGSFNGDNAVVLELQSKSWETSPRVNGKLVLRANAYSYSNQRLTFMRKTGSGATHVGTAGIGIGRSPGVELRNQTLTNIAGQRYYRHLDKSQAALLVSIAKWNESLRMVLDRAQKLDRKLQTLTDSKKQRKKRFRVRSDELGNDILEVKFGWMPLIHDIYAAMEALASVKIPPLHVKGSARENVMLSRSSSGSPRITDQVAGIRRVTLASDVRVTNPNAWLLSQLGLTNLGEAAWDWVPWSFLLNMFSNMSTVIGQFSPDVGINITNVSTTYTLNILRESKSIYGNGSVISCNVNSRTKERTLLNHPPVTLRFRLPSDPLGASVTLAALIAQRARRLTVLLPTLTTPRTLE